MLEVQLYSSEAKRKGVYVLPAEYDGRVNEAVLYQAVRAFLANRRRGTAATKTRAEVTGGSHKPWRQKGTGRARQGTIRAAHWRGGGVVFGPKPRSFRIELPRKVRQLARTSALNARALEGAIYVLESLVFGEPKTRTMAELIGKLGLKEKKILVLTADHRPDVFLSGRNIPDVRVLRYRDASAYDVLWSDVLVVEEPAVKGRSVGRAPKRAATAPPGGRRTGVRAPKGRAVKSVKTTAEKTATPPKKTTRKTTKKKVTRGGKGSDDA